MSMPAVIDYAELQNDPEFTKLMEFGGLSATVTAAPEGHVIDIGQHLRDPSDFHGSKLVHDVVQFGSSLAGLIGHYDDPNGFFADRQQLARQGIIVLSDYYPEAIEVVEGINDLAEFMRANPEKYDDRVFARRYYDLAARGYGLLRDKLPELGHASTEQSLPVSLVRAGMVTTRLALGLTPDATIEGELAVVTKRAHPKNGAYEHLMVTVKWQDPAYDPQRINGKHLLLSDFVNPASGASTAALIIAALNRGAKPDSVEHRSVMATRQGIEFWHKVFVAMGIRPSFVAVGSTDNLNPNYYLESPGVGDAGQVLRHFLPSWYDDGVAAAS